MKINPEHIERELEKRSQHRFRKRTPRMKVSGSSVRKLQRLIISKGTARKNS